MDRASLLVMAFTTSFRDLEVWQESMTLVEEIYTLSKSFPRDELFGLTAQLRKAEPLRHRFGISRRSGGTDRSRKAARLLQRLRLRSTSRARGARWEVAQRANRVYPARRAVDLGAWSPSNFCEPRT